MLERKGTMKKELIIKNCRKCGAIVNVLEDCNCNDCGIQCCGEKMMVLKPNSVDASFEKHLPTYEMVEDEIFTKVDHVMEKEHYIEWIALVTDTEQIIHKLYPEQNAEVRFKYVSGSILYAYCNKHGLWKTEVE